LFIPGISFLEKKNFLLPPEILSIDIRLYFISWQARWGWGEVTACRGGSSGAGTDSMQASVTKKSALPWRKRSLTALC